MEKCITFGDYNPKYKYIFYYILMRIPFEYFFGTAFPEEIKIDFVRYENMANSLLVYDIFAYSAILIFGLIIFKLEFKEPSDKKNLIKTETDSAKHTNKENNPKLLNVPLLASINNATRS